MDYEEAVPFKLAGKKEQESLLGNGDKYSTELLYQNFYAMSIAFSITHGCTVTCLAFASTELGDELGSVANGILYVFYAVTAFLMAKPIESALGPKLGLLLGVIGYSVYVCGFFFAILFSYSSIHMSWLLACSTAAIGGLSGGILWTAQGNFFSQNSKLFCESSGAPVDIVNTTFASIFATSFLGVEMLTKLFATLIYLLAPLSAPFLIFFLYTAVSISGCFVISRLDNLGLPPTFDFSYVAVSRNAIAAAKLVYLDIRLSLLVPFQLAFGFASSFVPYYIFGTVISDSENLGTTYIGVLSAVVVFSGAMRSHNSSMT
jgi:hypothetical protein